MCFCDSDASKEISAWTGLIQPVTSMDRICFGTERKCFCVLNACSMQSTRIVPEGDRRLKKSHLVKTNSRCQRETEQSSRIVYTRRCGYLTLRKSADLRHRLNLYVSGVGRIISPSLDECVELYSHARVQIRPNPMPHMPWKRVVNVLRTCCHWAILIGHF